VVVADTPGTELHSIECTLLVSLFIYCVLCVNGTADLTLSAEDLHMQVSQAADSRQGQLDHALDGDRVAVEILKQRAVLMIV